MLLTFGLSAQWSAFDDVMLPRLCAPRRPMVAQWQVFQYFAGIKISEATKSSVPQTEKIGDRVR